MEEKKLTSHSFNESWGTIVSRFPDMMSAFFILQTCLHGRHISEHADLSEAEKAAIKDFSSSFDQVWVHSSNLANFADDKIDKVVSFEEWYAVYKQSREQEDRENMLNTYANLCLVNAELTGVFDNCLNHLQQLYPSRSEASYALNARLAEKERELLEKPIQ